MAKGKYEYWLTPDGLLLLAAWARDGLTDEQIAGKMGITRKTLYNWKEAHLPILHALKRNKEIVDIEVENGLLDKTRGQIVRLQKTFKVKRTEYDPITGKKVLEKEELEVGIDEVFVQADTTAQIFWLKNRKPAEWRDKSEVDHNVTIKLEDVL